MTDDAWRERLSQIVTSWRVLQDAHEGAASQAADAQRVLMERYQGAICRYLLAVVRDPHVVDELFQQFALALVRGDFRNVSPERGRFRDYIKTVLFHLVGKHRRGELKRPLALGDEDGRLANDAAAADNERCFLESWRDELLARTWRALAEAHAASHTVLRIRVDHPDWTSEQLSQALAERGFMLNAAALRQTLRRARQRFAELLVEETAQSLASSTRDDLESELADLNLLEYCRDALPAATTPPARNDATKK